MRYHKHDCCDVQYIILFFNATSVDLVTTLFCIRTLSDGEA